MYNRKYFENPPAIKISIGDDTILNPEWASIIEYVSSHPILQFASELGVLPDVFINKYNQYVQLSYADNPESIHADIFQRGRELSYDILKHMADYNESLAIKKLESLAKSCVLTSEMIQFVSHTRNTIDKIGSKTRDQILRSLFYLRNDDSQILDILSDSMVAYKDESHKFYMSPPLDYSCPIGISDRFLDYIYAMHKSHESSQDIQKNYAAHLFSSYYHGSVPGKLLLSSLFHLSIKDLSTSCLGIKLYESLDDDMVSEIMNKASHITESMLAEFLRMDRVELLYVLYRSHDLDGLKITLESTLQFLVEQNKTKDLSKIENKNQKIAFCIDEMSGLIIQDESVRNELALSVMRQWLEKSHAAILSHEVIIPQICIFLSKQYHEKLTPLIVEVIGHPDDNHYAITHWIILARYFSSDMKYWLGQKYLTDLHKITDIDPMRTKLSVMLAIAFGHSHNRSTHIQVSDSMLSEVTKSICEVYGDIDIVKCSRYFKCSHDRTHVTVLRLVEALLSSMALEENLALIIDVIGRSEHCDLLSYLYVIKKEGPFNSVPNHIKNDTLLTKFSFHLGRISLMQSGRELFHSIISKILLLGDELIKDVFGSIVDLQLHVYEGNERRNWHRKYNAGISQYGHYDHLDMIWEKAVQLKSPLSALMCVFLPKVNNEYRNKSGVDDYVLDLEDSKHRAVLSRLNNLTQELTSTECTAFVDFVMNLCKYPHLFFCELLSHHNLEHRHAHHIVKRVLPTVSNRVWHRSYETTQQQDVMTLSQQFVLYCKFPLLRKVYMKGIIPQSVDFIRDDPIAEVSFSTMNASTGRSCLVSRKSVSLTSLTILKNKAIDEYSDIMEKLDFFYNCLGGKSFRNDDFDCNELHHLMMVDYLRVKSSDELCLKKLLNYREIKIDQPDIEGSTSLHYAIRYGKLHLAQILLDYRANLLFMKNNQGEDFFDLFRDLIASIIADRNSMDEILAIFSVMDVLTEANKKKFAIRITDSNPLESSRVSLLTKLLRSRSLIQTAQSTSMIIKLLKLVSQYTDEKLDTKIIIDILSCIDSPENQNYAGICYTTSLITSIFPLVEGSGNLAYLLEPTIYFIQTMNGIMKNVDFNTFYSVDKLLELLDFLPDYLCKILAKCDDGQITQFGPRLLYYLLNKKIYTEYDAMEKDLHLIKALILKLQDYNLDTRLPYKGVTLLQQAISGGYFANLIGFAEDNMAYDLWHILVNPGNINQVYTSTDLQCHSGFCEHFSHFTMLHFLSYQFLGDGSDPTVLVPDLRVSRFVSLFRYSVQVLGADFDSSTCHCISAYDYLSNVVDKLNCISEKEGNLYASAVTQIKNLLSHMTDSRRAKRYISAKSVASPVSFISEKRGISQGYDMSQQIDDVSTTKRARTSDSALSARRQSYS